MKDKQIQTDASPIIEQGRVLVPIRAVAESLDATVNWDYKSRTAKVQKWSKIVTLTVGNIVAQIEGKPKYLSSGDNEETLKLDVAAKIINNRIYIPLRSITQLFGYHVNWENNTVYIISPMTKWKTWLEGDLSDARNFAMSLPASFQYEHKPLDIDDRSEGFYYEFLFPEGEALRFYYIFKNTVSFIQLKDDFPVVVWQEYIQEWYSIEQMLEQGIILKQDGTTPIINKPFLFYGRGGWGDSSNEESGHIDLDRKFTITGYKLTVGGSVTVDSGSISLVLPGEKRIDAR